MFLSSFLSSLVLAHLEHVQPIAKYHFGLEIFCARNNSLALAQDPMWFIKFCSALLAAPLLKVPKGTFCEVGCAVES